MVTLNPTQANDFRYILPLTGSDDTVRHYARLAQNLAWYPLSQVLRLLNHLHRSGRANQTSMQDRLNELGNGQFSHHMLTKFPFHTPP